MPFQDQRQAEARADLAAGPWRIGRPAFVDADIAFHAAVVAAAHNPVLSDPFANPHSSGPAAE
ncbi:FCD domain-containing protein [Streptomyces sp. NPDC051987]|uniref:FCD domain-containing protein n=1 Tax=Streptomyces sp. NPDC051987 TaxID=3155808 RepID=UPI0034154EF1